VNIYRSISSAWPDFDRFAKLAPAVAAKLSDTSLNMDPAVAVSSLQQALNAPNRGASDKPDIVRGPRIDGATLASLTGVLTRRKPNGEVVLMRAFEALQGERYLDLAQRRPADEAFLYGRLANRLD
jgi:lysozyme family protein